MCQKFRDNTLPIVRGRPAGRLIAALNALWLGAAVTGWSVAVLAADSATGVGDIPTIIVTATRTEVDEHRVPATIQSLSNEHLLHELQTRTLPEALRTVPGVMVQKTGHGQGSPYIRGFTGFRNVLLVDGIRMNNSIFRDGPNQYWNTIDPLSIDRLEVVKSPGSVTFGSDAVGGVVNALSQGPASAAGFDTRLYYRYSSAERADILRLQGGYYNEAGTGLRGGITLKDFGDLQGGDQVGSQPNTGYDEADGDVRIDWFGRRGMQLTLAHQQVHQSDAWRTHSTVFGTNWAGLDNGSDLKRALDQDRALTYAQVTVPELGNGNHQLRASVSLHAQDEEQIRIRGSGRRDEQGIDVDTAGLWFQVESQFGDHRLVYGTDFYRDDVQAFRRDFNADGSLRPGQPVTPVADNSHYDLFGAFVQDQWQAVNNVEITAGLRYTYASAEAADVFNPAGGERWQVDESWSDVSGSLRVLYRPRGSEALSLFGGVSQAFRAPNLSDLTRFGIARSNEIEIPVQGLEPETFTALEAGMRWDLPVWSGQAALFYTDIHDLIVREPTGEMLDGAFVVSRRNASEGRVRGVEISNRVALAPRWSAQIDWAWLDGEQEVFADSSRVAVTEPISRLMPAWTHLSLRFSPSQRSWYEMAVRHSADGDRLSSRDVQDTQRIPPGGTPGWTVLDLRAGLSAGEHLRIAAAIENLLDKDYRVHGSGINEAGRNVVITLDWRH